MSGRRVMLVVSNDYGELATALYFIEGQALDALLCVPPRLAAANAGALPPSTRTWRSMDEIVAAADDHRAELILLFSGYLYAINGLLELSAVQTLVEHFQSRSVPIATSDPFLGLVSGNAPAPWNLKHPYSGRLAGHFLTLSRSLSTLPQLYVVNPRGLPVSQAFGFFNPSIKSPGVVDAGPWLFILSAEDYAGQIAKLGRERFTALARKLLQQTRAAGRIPVLMAPSPLAIDELKGEEGTLLHFCGHQRFRELLIAAEYVFYWNIVSNSILVRVLNTRPFFFFDEGHLLSALPALGERARRWYYPDSALPFLDPNADLDSASLAVLAAKQDFSKTARLIRGLPSPAQIVETLVSGGRDAA